MVVRSLNLERKKIIKSIFHLQAIVFILKLYFLKMERQKLKSVLKSKSRTTQPSGVLVTLYVLKLCVFWKPQITSQLISTSNIISNGKQFRFYELSRKKLLRQMS